MLGASTLPVDWPAPLGVRALTTLRTGPGESLAPFDRCNLGLRCGDDRAHALANRRRLVVDLGLPGAPRWLQQVHGSHVARFDRGETEFSRGLAAGDADEPIADAAVTSSIGVTLAILTADCLPVLLCSRDGQHVGAAHAGWRGLVGGVIEATVAAMAVPADRLMAWLGPAAGPEHYEIGEEVRQAFLELDPSADVAFVPTREHHWRVDLYWLARRRLAAVGVDRVFGGGLCTIADPQRFYSHRRDQRTGRMASLFWME